MFNEMIVVKVAEYKGTDGPDKNGKMPVFLVLQAGRMPNRQTLTGTVAEMQGFKVGNTYLANVREAGYDKQFGTTFDFTALEELHGTAILDAIQKLPKAEVVIIDRPEGYEDTYTRKSNAVEGQRTKRIKEGNYIPSTPKSNIDHKTAPEVRDGSSTKDNNDVDLLRSNAKKPEKTKDFSGK